LQRALVDSNENLAIAEVFLKTLNQSPSQQSLSILAAFGKGRLSLNELATALDELDFKSLAFNRLF
jgi:hypothetical protein